MDERRLGLGRRVGAKPLGHASQARPVLAGRTRGVLELLDDAVDLVPERAPIADLDEWLDVDRVERRERLDETHGEALAGRRPTVAFRKVGSERNRLAVEVRHHQNRIAEERLVRADRDGGRRTNRCRLERLQDGVLPFDRVERLAIANRTGDAHHVSPFGLGRRDGDGSIEPVV
nr:hypothetical protein [Halovivax limisalsi]